MSVSNDEYIRLRDAYACAMNWLEDEEGNLPKSIPPETKQFLHKELVDATVLADRLNAIEAQQASEKNS